MNVRPARVRQSGQSLILDSKQGIPDSRYWISHSTCPLAGFRIPKPRISDFQAKITLVPESGLPHISGARTKSPNLSPASKRETDPRLNNISQQK